MKPCCLRWRAPALLSLFLALFAVGQAQPSGGPYGPVRMTYEVPKQAPHVYYVAPDGRAESGGTKLEEPTTLESAISRAVTGDAVILRGGTYRTGGLVLNQGILLQPYRDEVPVLKGSRVADKWEKQRNGLWRASWDKLFPMKPADWWRRGSHGHDTPQHRFNNDMVFVDGRFLQSAGWEGELNESNYFIDYEKGHVYLALDPTGKQIEITAFDSAMVRTIGSAHGRASDGKGPQIRGLTFTQYAYRAFEFEATEPEKLADPATFGKEIVGTLLENVTITFCSRVGGYFRGDKLVIRNCLVSDTSTEGIFILNSADVLLERNLIMRNNIEKIMGYYPSAVKIFNQSYRVVCRDNLVIDQPDSNGIWYDVGNVDGVFVNNWIEGCIDGFFFEISKGATCAGNVFVNCEKGIRVLNSSNVHVYQNTLVNTPAAFERTERSAVGDHFGWHPSTGPDVDEREGHIFVNNLLVADASFRRPVLQFDQPAKLCDRLTKPQVSQLDGNVYIRRGEGGGIPLIQWSPVAGQDCKAMLASPQELHTQNGSFAAGDVYVKNYYGSVFQSHQLGHYRLAKPFAIAPRLAPVPDKVLGLLGWTKAPAAAGAYGN